MLRRVVGQLDLLRDRVPARNRGRARVERRTVNTLATSLPELLAREPVITPARSALGAVGAVRAVLPVNIPATQDALIEAVLGRLLLRVGGEVGGVGELVDEGLVLADAVGEHAAVVAVVVDAPLDGDDVARRVGLDDFVAPGLAGLVVVDAHAGVVAAGAAAANGGGVEVGPRCNRFQDGALGAGVSAGL